jgi:hypothetical protein
VFGRQGEAQEIKRGASVKDGEPRIADTRCIAWAQMDKYWLTFKAVMFGLSIVLFFFDRVAKVASRLAAAV